MRKATTSILMIAVIATCGCKSTGFLAKREAEKCCPTDIRKTVPWCAGEDALFHCPCEPSAAFYGYKPTCWRTWPADGAAWRDVHCGKEHHHAVITDLTRQNPELIELPPLESAPEPPKAVDSGEEPTTPDARSESSEHSIQIKPTPVPQELPRLKRTPVAEPTPEVQPSSKPEQEDPEAFGEDLSLPILGPIPLPPVEDE